MDAWIILSILMAIGAILLLAPVVRRRGGDAAPDAAASLDRRTGNARRAVAPIRFAADEHAGAGVMLAGSAIIGALALYLAYDNVAFTDGGPVLSSSVQQDDRYGVTALETAAAAMAQTRSAPAAQREDDEPQRAGGRDDESDLLMAGRARTPNDVDVWARLIRSHKAANEAHAEDVAGQAPAEPARTRDTGEELGLPK
jgi:hypothetical protein